MRAAIVGGGPAGLFFARLLKRSQPEADVHVYEQGREGATWGFGVGLGGRAMARIADIDRPVYDRLAAAMLFTSEQAIVLGDERLNLVYTAATGAISRLKLLGILTDACRDAGVVLHFETPPMTADTLPPADLVVAADGVNSRLRDAHAASFGTERSVADEPLRLVRRRPPAFALGAGLPAFRGRDIRRPLLCL